MKRHEHREQATEGPYYCELSACPQLYPSSPCEPMSVDCRLVDKLQVDSLVNLQMAVFVECFSLIINHVELRGFTS